MDSEEALALLLRSGSLLVMANCNKQKNRRRWWRTNLFNSRHGAELLRDLQFQHVSGQYKIFTRMTPTDFENQAGYVVYVTHIAGIT
jgi:hypothetical protein